MTTYWESNLAMFKDIEYIIWIIFYLPSQFDWEWVWEDIHIAHRYLTIIMNFNVLAEMLYLAMGNLSIIVSLLPTVPIPYLPIYLS